MNPRVLPKEAWDLVRRLHRAEMLAPWILAGGTGIALQLGHRISIDLDFFSEDSFDTAILRQNLSAVGRVTVQAEAENTLHTQVDGIRLSYLRSEAPFLFPAVDYRGLRLADLRDIGAMKVIAVAGRGSRKDFVDLYAYLQAGGTFSSLMQTVRKRYTRTTYNEMHLLRSLVYFEDAEQEPMPRMLDKLEWPAIRARLEEEARRWAP